jgi:hypothetical protein
MIKMVEKNRIVLNDGTEIENGLISKISNKQILIVIPGTDIVNATITFSDKLKTKKMIAYHNIYKNTFIGFTSISSMSVRTNDEETHIYMIGENTSMKYEYTVPEVYVSNSGNQEDHEDE